MRRTGEANPSPASNCVATIGGMTDAPESLGLVIDPGADAPPYAQLKAQIVAGRDSGELAADQRLPTVRALAASLDLAPNTVARAYRELEREGVIETRGRRGSFVTGTAASAEKAAAAAAREYAATVRQLGIADSRAVSLLRAALGELG